VEGIILAAQTDVARGRAYFISGERIYSVREVNEVLMQIIGKRARIVSIPRFVAFGVALLAEGAAAVTGKAPVINRDKVKDFSQESWACSIDAAKKDLGFHDSTPLEEGLRETYDWYKKEGWL
ncbi:MAG: NAD-dependent epimerase/dehydratase family protein, partial [Blastocatellia bacterium]